ncbi:MAG: hypothetical protein M3Y08_11530 [Fibrobacterota bacterium]|nr:hypothetical protein [Fibrobacterota bacterium]
MHSLLEFLTAAPKTFVIKLHRRDQPGEGLMQAAKVVHLVYDWALKPERIAETLKSAEAHGRHLLALVYASEERGAAESELLGSLEGFPPSQALMLLGKLEQEVLIFSREGDKGRTFHGFRELAEVVLPAVLKDQWLGGSSGVGPTGVGAETASWISFRHFLTSHLSHFLCQVALGNVKITQSGEMHRKDAQELAQRFTFGERLSSALPAEEVQLLLHFSVGASLVLQEDGLLHLSPEGRILLRGERREAWRRMAEWWMEDRVHGMAHTLTAVASLPVEFAAGRVSPWANILWIYSGPHRKGYHDPKASFTWENLPKALQELWLLGLVDFGMSKGRIAWVRPDRVLISYLVSRMDPLTDPGHSKDAGDGNSGHPTRPISLPNMESLVPLDSPFGWQHRLELVGHKSNDEFMGRYRFTKETVIQGLQAGLGMEEFRDLLAWLGFEGPAQQTLVEWASTYASTLFMDTLVLKVSDPVRFGELQEIPQFLEMITEVIPDYGFVLNRQNKQRVKELLQHFGLVPGEDSRRVLDLMPASLGGIGNTWVLPRPEFGPLAYRESSGSLRAPPPQPQDKNGQAAREQELAQRIETLEDAIAGEKKIEFSYAAPILKRISLKPLLLLKHKDPIKFIGIELDSGHRNEYVLEQAKALRIME